MLPSKYVILRTKFQIPSLKTIGGLYQDLDVLSEQLGDVPTPLHAELPSLKVRTQSLENKVNNR